MHTLELKSGRLKGKTVQRVNRRLLKKNPSKKNIEVRDKLLTKVPLSGQRGKQPRFQEES